MFVVLEIIIDINWMDTYDETDLRVNSNTTSEPYLEVTLLYYVQSGFIKVSQLYNSDLDGVYFFLE